MNFNNENIRLKIKGAFEKEPLTFKAYLEKSDVQVKFVDETLKYTPLGYTNNTLLTKVIYNVDFSFNVFSEDLEEAVQNYVYLHKLFNIIKPSYKIKNNQYIPNSENIFGLLDIFFKGLPVLGVTEWLPVYVTNFNYQINKEMGFIEADFPYDFRGDFREDFEQLDKEGSDKTIKRDLKFEGIATFKNYRLIPLAYKLEIAGRVQLPLKQSIWNKSMEKENAALKAIAESQGNDINVAKDLRNILIKFSGDEDILEKLTPEELSNAIEKIKFFKEKGLLDDNGDIQYERIDNGDSELTGEKYQSQHELPPLLTKEYEGRQKECIDNAIQQNLSGVNNLKSAIHQEECFTKLMNFDSTKDTLDDLEIVEDVGPSVLI